MSIWIEIHCDHGIPWPRRDREAGIDGGCKSDQNANPAGMADNTADSVARVCRIIRAEAQAGGWVFKRGMWACPRCARLLAQKSLHKGLP